MLLEIRPPAATSSDSHHLAHARPPEPALASFHPLILAACRATRRFPGADPVELGASLRGAALAAAEAVLAACQPAGSGLTGVAALGEAMRRLRELASLIEIARRLGYLAVAPAAELLALLAGTRRAVWQLGDRLAQAPGSTAAASSTTANRRLDFSGPVMQTGHMRDLSATEFKAKCLAVLDEVARTGEPVVICKRGRPVARLVPATGVDSGYAQHSLLGTVRIVGDVTAPVLPSGDWEAESE